MRIILFAIIVATIATLVVSKDIPESNVEVQEDELREEKNCRCSCDDSKGRNALEESQTDREQDFRRAFQIPTPNCNCACVVCTFTVDNKVEIVKYNGSPLTISGGNVNDWLEEKVISFESCCDSCPGVLEIKGTNWENSNHCQWAGLLLRCTASRASSPWHNFVSDVDHWKIEDNASPCQNNLLMFQQSGSWEPFISSLNSFGAKKIWNEKENATLRGSPAF